MSLRKLREYIQTLEFEKYVSKYVLTPVEPSYRVFPIEGGQFQFLNLHTIVTHALLPSELTRPIFSVVFLHDWNFHALPLYVLRTPSSFHKSSLS